MDETLAAEALPKKKGIPGSTIKLIAIITMLIDHVGAVLLERVLIAQGLMGAAGNPEAIAALVAQNRVLYAAYMTMRLIGRLGFPLFCFLLIEGFTHTADVKKYALRLGLFAIVSEVPFDLGFKGQFFDWSYQNVFFTLLIGVLVMMGFRLLEERQAWNKWLKIALHLPILAAGMALAQFMKTDYAAWGVLTIVVMYLLRNRKTWSAAAGCATLSVMTLGEIPAFLTIPLIHRYNGERGWNIKWLFYAFYPAHILILYLIARALGIA